MTPKTKRKSTAKKVAEKAATKSKASGGNVAVIGGGIAGLTAALKLLKAGFAVTLFEKNDRLGGNMSSAKVNGVEHDVYPHMFCDWYDNFWQVYEEDLGLSREAHFQPRAGVKMFKEGAKTYDELLNPTSLEAIITNLKSGAMSPAEMFLMGYSMVDLAGYPFNREGNTQLDKQSVNGFLYSQSTSSEQVAELENYMLQVIWSIRSEQTSAVTYQDFIRHTLSFPNGAPFAHMLKSSLQDGVIAPIEALIKKLGGKIETSTEVEAIRLVDDTPQLHWRKTGSNARSKSGIFDQVVIAVPAKPLTDLVLGNQNIAKGDRIIDREQSLSQVRRLRSVPIPVIDIYLKRKLPGFPAENIGLTNAKYGLSVVDIAQLWDGDFDGKTALVIAASDGESLPGHDFDAQAWFMMQELQRYYPDIDIGKKWGDPDCDIDWGKTYARSNADYGLFLNDVGSWDWMPATVYPGTLPNIAFAGDLCRGNVDMATIEGAVESGVRAAAAVQHFDAAVHGGTTRGKPIELVKHQTYGNTALRAAKIALMPFAYLAKGWTLLNPSAGNDNQIRDLGHALQSEHVALLPLQYAVDWWTTAYWFWNAALSKDEGDAPHGPSNHTDDDFIGLGAAMLMVLGEFASYATEKCQKGSVPVAYDNAAKPGDALVGLTRMAGRFAQGLMGDKDFSAPDPTNPYKRRWHPKR